MSNNRQNSNVSSVKPIRTFNHDIMIQTSPTISVSYHNIDNIYSGASIGYGRLWQLPYLGSMVKTIGK